MVTGSQSRVWSGPKSHLINEVDSNLGGIQQPKVSLTTNQPTNQRIVGGVIHKTWGGILGTSLLLTGDTVLIVSSIVSIAYEGMCA